MRTLTRRILGLGLATAALAACSDTSVIGGETLTTSEKLALNTALTSSGALNGAGGAAAFAPLAITLLPNIGSLSSGAATAAVRGAIDASLRGVMAASYEGAVGVQIAFTFGTGASQETGSFTGVVGWSGLNAAASTVEEIVTAGALTTGTAPISGGQSTPIGGSATGPDRTGVGTYFVRTGQATYVGTSGAFVLNSATFGSGGVNCAAVAQVTTCNYVAGTMSGTFNFAASKVSGTGGAATYTQTPITFTNLPSLRITIVD